MNKREDIFFIIIMLVILFLLILNCRMAFPFSHTDKVFSIRIRLNWRPPGFHYEEEEIDWNAKRVELIIYRAFQDYLLEVEAKEEKNGRKRF